MVFVRRASVLRLLWALGLLATRRDGGVGDGFLADDDEAVARRVEDEDGCRGFLADDAGVRERVVRLGGVMVTGLGRRIGAGFAG